MDAHVLDHHKENIVPLLSGRLALKLGNALSKSESRLQLTKKRESLEMKLKLDDLDDPLEPYIEYIEWTHNHYPQGGSSDSGLLKLLEKCTSHFRDTPYYKNDPRYLKIWLEYAGYLDLPRDVFVYLAKKEIGIELALYYEEFARLLESKAQIGDARQVYEVGLERNARPHARLLRNFEHFSKRTKPANAASSDMRAVLSGRMSPSPVSEDQTRKRQKISIFKDEHSPSLKNTIFKADANSKLSSIAFGKKENHRAATPWAGEIQRQKTDTEKQPAKFQVFRDEPEQPGKEYEVVEDQKGVCSIVRQPGKPEERVLVNLDLVYPSPGEEYCFAEILALSRRLQASKKQGPAPKKLVSHVLTQMASKHPDLHPTQEHTHTITIPLRDDDSVQPQSPTMTMYSKMTTREVLGMFNDAAHNFQLDDESTRGFEESTNYDGFVTETIEAKQPEEPRVATPPTDQYESEGSLPFLERPLRERRQT